MKILKSTGNYLKNKSESYKNIVIFLIIIGLSGLGYSLFIIRFDLVYIFIIVLIFGCFFLQKHVNYKNGLYGENLVEHPEYAEHFGISKVSELIEAANGSECLVVTKVRQNKDKTQTYMDITKIQVL